MRQWRVGTLTTGIVLIAAGVVMIAGRAGGWTAVDKLVKWWPVVIILLGLEIIISSLLYKNEHTRIRMDGFSVFMIILVIFVCVGAYGIDAVANGSFIGSFDGIHFGSKYHTRYDKNYTINAKDKDKLVIDNGYGSVSVSRGTGDNIEVKAEIDVYNNDEEYARSISDSLIKIEENNPVKIQSKLGDSSIDENKVQSLIVKYDIKVPEKLSIDISNNYGPVNIEQISGAVSIKNGFGHVEGQVGVGVEDEVAGGLAEPGLERAPELAVDRVVHHADARVLAGELVGDHGRRVGGRVVDDQDVVAPDLAVDHIDAAWSADGLRAGRLDALRIDGVRVRGARRGDALSFGALDALFGGERSASAAPPVLPASSIEIADGKVEIETPQGVAKGTLGGSQIHLIQKILHMN
jgi:hypothetical protein